MKKVALGLLILFVASILVSCAGYKNQRNSFGSCNAQKRNNHKASRTFLY